MKKFKTILKTSDKNIIEAIKRYNGTQDKDGLWIITATTKYEKEQNDNNRIFMAYVIKEDVLDKKILSKEERIARFREKFGANDTKKTNNQYGGIEWWVNGMNGE